MKANVFSVEDILDLGGTDAICVCKTAMDIDLSLTTEGYDFDFDFTDETYYCADLMEV